MAVPTLFWDASALVKHYFPEPGSKTVAALFEEIPAIQMACTLFGYAEAYAILRRRRNNNQIGAIGYAAARSTLKYDVLEGVHFELLDVTSSDVLAGLKLIDRHNLNSSDAAILAAYLDYRTMLPAGSGPCALIASDHRLLRAARAEGLPALDPEAVDAADVSAFLNAL